MNSGSNDGGFARRLVTWLIVGIVAIIALKLALVTLGLAMRFAFVALFTLGPLLLIGWLVVKALRHFTRDTGPASGF